jgi:hypothetical protein
VWRTGTGAPSNSTGVDGDYYLNSTTGDVYTRASGAYSVTGNIKGAKGDTGTAGTNGTNGADGTNGTNGGGFIYAKKTANETVANTTTVQADDNLTIPIGANETLEFEALIFVTSGGGSFKVFPSAPTGSTIRWEAMLVDSASTTPVAIYGLDGTVSMSWTMTNYNAGTGAGSDWCQVKGVVTNGATAGNLTLFWAQKTANAGVTTVQAKSFIRAGKM